MDVSRTNSVASGNQAGSPQTFNVFGTNTYAEEGTYPVSVTVTSSGAAHWDAEPKRFLDATIQSLPIANTLPAVAQTADFTRTVWPQTTQKALLGQVSPDEMMKTFETLYFG